MTLSEYIDRLEIVIVTFGVDWTCCATIKHLLACPEAHHENLNILVFDNSPQKTDKTGIDNAKCRITYIPQANNPGVSTSYNKACRIAKEQRKEWMLFFDHDAVFGPDIIQKYYDAFIKFPGSKLYCSICKLPDGKILSPFLHIAGRSFCVRTIHAGMYRSKMRSVINNGVLVKINGFETLGGYNENLPLDFSDISFFRNYKKKYSYFVVVDNVINHSLDSVAETDKKRALRRFAYYCSGSVVYAHGLLVHPVLIGALFRAVKLTMHWKDMRFMQVWFSFTFLRASTDVYARE